MSERLSAMFFKVIVPLAAIGFMLLFCYPVCNRPEGFDFFLFWILVGFPFWNQAYVAVAHSKKLWHSRFTWSGCSGLHHRGNHRWICCYYYFCKSRNCGNTDHSREAVMV